MGNSHRTGRVADRIKEVVASALESKVKDPRLGFVTITDVRVTGDLQSASIFYTVLGSDEERNATSAALKSATGLLRSEVGHALGTRLTPTITFFEDALGESASTFESLLDEVRRHDAEVAKIREGAKPVGEADPYRHSPKRSDQSNA
ncbi:MAG: 30S ribosome-binding factor RbfA [Candidatus Nanopelagicaceae bacterium]|jgi:ribosome-binding factor A